jgi:nucleoid-associated protein YgaU
MGLLDKIMGNNEPAKKADFSDVQSGSSSTAPAPAASATAGRTYTVVSGDSLSKIAKHQYGDAAKWHAIYEANRDKIKNPDLIYPGQVLTIPDIS